MRKEIPEEAPLLAEPDLCILDGSVPALRLAGEQAALGKRVLVAVRETYLGGGLCAGMAYEADGESSGFFPEEVLRNQMLQPDAAKRWMEDWCIRRGIRILYGIYPLDCQEETRVGQGLRLRVAAKGGVFVIRCGELFWGESRAEHTEGPGCYRVQADGVPDRAGVLWEEEGSSLCSDGSIGYLTVELPGCANTPENLLFAMQRAEEAFCRARSKLPGLSLGRFAERILPRERHFCETAETVGKESVFFQTGSGLPGDGGIYHGEGTADAWRCQVLVVGGGTAGAMAALYAARGGADTILVEPCSTLGGTATAGGVSTYWFGSRFSEVREIDRLTDVLQKRLHVERKEGIWSEYDDFHPGIRGQVLLEQCLRAGVRIRLREFCFGAVMEEGKEGRRCAGVVTAGVRGIKAYLADLVIDGTGDGDVAVFAGADSVYGSGDDCFTYWASLAQYTDARRYRNNFSSMTVCADPEDFTRFILAGRRRGEQTCEHGTYVSMRESRHIRGCSTVTLKDLMQFRTYPDGLYTCYSNYDPKGKLDADAVYCGYLPPQARIQIPLGALLPCDAQGRRIRGLYVAGKAISATHNVFPSIRMQPDLMHQGAVLGALCAACAARGCGPEELTQKERSMLLEQVTDDRLEPPGRRRTLEEQIRRLRADSRSHWVDVPFTYTETEESALSAIVTADAHEALPLLRARLMEETQDPMLRLQLICCCLWHGCTERLEELAEYVLRELSGSELPGREGSVMCAQLLPDHGVMPETVYRMNLLGMSGDPRILPVFERALELLWQAKRDYLDIRKGIFHYIESFARAAERSGDRRWIPMLERLASLGEMEQAAREQESTGLLTERLLMLRLLLFRALAGLGSEAGKAGLRELSRSRIRALALSAQLALGRGEAPVRQGKIW